MFTGNVRFIISPPTLNFFQKIHPISNAPSSEPSAFTVYLEGHVLCVSESGRISLSSTPSSGYFLGAVRILWTGPVRKQRKAQEGY